ncbi:MAG TPA: STAS domain-containing protein [Candidatus Sumerlaeota bacterium]|nr:STAS domain-containing protein [Candidatus Sumerlaeota bacterium]
MMKIQGRIDAVKAPIFEKDIAPLLEEGQQDAPILDFTDVEYISSSGLRVLMHAARVLKMRDRKLTLTGVRPDVFSVLKMAGFCDFLDVNRLADEGGGI